MNRTSVFHRGDLGALVATGVLCLLALPVGQTMRLVIGCGLALAFSAEKAMQRTTHSSFESVPLLWFAASAGWLTLAAVVGTDPTLSVLWVIAFGGLVSFGASIVGRFGHHAALRIIFTALAIPVLIALVSIIGPVLADRVFDLSDRVVINKDMAAFFAVTTALLVRFSSALERLPKLATIVTYVVAAIVVVASDSRSMAVAAVVALAFGLVQAGKVQLVAATGLVGLVFWGFAVLFLGVDAGGVFDLVSTDVAEGGGRDDLWAAAWTAMVDRPLFGFGLGTHVDVLLEYRLQSLFGIKSVTTHNVALFAGLAGGFPAIALLTGAAVAAFRNAETALRVIFVALIVFGLGDAPFETPGVVLVFFGVAAASPSRWERHYGASSTRRPKTSETAEASGRRPSPARQQEPTQQ